MSLKREEALKLAEELLADIELKRLGSMDITRKASRLARLTDDVDAMSWLSFEVAGYPQGARTLETDASDAGERSNRNYLDDVKETRFRIAGIGELEVGIETTKLQLTSKATTSTLNESLKKDLMKDQGLVDRIIGSIYVFVTTKYQELRFGNEVEAVFETIRIDVDSNIAKLVPDALPLLSTALENSRDANPIQWANAAKACRDILKATADALRPPGPATKKGVEMTDARYVNRLMDWIERHTKSKSSRNLYASDLHDLGTRLDAVTTGGHKGAHTQELTKQQASRLIIGTYMLLGDILSLAEEVPDTVSEKHSADIVIESGQLSEELVKGTTKKE